MIYQKVELHKLPFESFVMFTQAGTKPTILTHVIHFNAIIFSPFKAIKSLNDSKGLNKRKARIL